jgi:hypothetical protein
MPKQPEYRSVADVIGTVGQFLLNTSSDDFELIQNELAHLIHQAAKGEFIVTNLARPAERVVAFYNQRGTAEQCIKEGKGAIKWTRMSCRTFTVNAVRLQLHALAYNLGNFMRTLALPQVGRAMVADQPQGEADQDRREGRQPWPLRHLPDGRGRDIATDVRRNSVADRPTASAAGARMRSAGVTEATDDERRGAP